jgi:hypothetical protein
MKKMLLCVFSVCTLLTGTVGGQSQITTGVIQGTVTDPSGGVVPGADVEAKNLDTNVSRSMQTDADGRFVFLQLQPGRYTVTIKKQGFATIVQENINLTVGQTVSLAPAMKVSAAQEVITVTETATVETTKTEISSTLNNRTVGNTPVLGRKFEDLLTLTPGVSIVQGPDGDEITFSGQRGIFTNVSLDGGDYINGFFGEQVGGQRAAIDIPLDAVKEFQVVASGASAEFGRTAAGVVNVISRSGTNDWHGSIYHFQRHENLSSNTSDGKPLKDFHREQYGATVGGPIVRDKAFFFFAIERITGNLQRDNLSAQLGATACPQTTFTLGNGQASEAAIRTNPDCARLAVTNFIRATRSQEEALPVRRPLYTTSPFFKLDLNLTENHTFAFSYNFNASKKVNETFDVSTYGNSANGIEGNFTKINVLNFNLLSTLSPTKVNEAHFTYSREVRPRTAVSSNVPADTAMGITGFNDSFRFGAPFFLHPSIDEVFWRTQIRDNFTWVAGKHTVKFGGEWIHSLNDQVFRGFFQGRYIFLNTLGFLRYASPQAAGGFGPTVQACSNNTFITTALAETCPVGTTNTGSPLLLFLQGAGPSGPATDAAGASTIDNEEFSLFIQDKWQIRPNLALNYGLRWDAQIFPQMSVAPSATAYGFALSNPAFPSDGTLHSDKQMWQPRLGLAWDIASNQKSVFRANFGIYNARQNMLTQVGSITTNGVQQQTIAGGAFAAPIFPTWPNLVTPTASTCGTNPFPCFSGVRVFHRDYRNPRVYSTNFAFEQEVAPDWSIYTDFTWSKGVFLTRFFNWNRNELGALFAINLGEVFTTTSFGQSLYRGWTVGMRKRFSKKYQLEWNYVLAYDYDDDSNERDPFTDRARGTTTNAALCPGTGCFLEPRADFGLSDRDIRHKFNFFTYAELPWAFEVNVRVQARSAQPTSVSQAAFNRNTARKENEFFALDWRVQRPFRFGERFKFTPLIEMFNTFNNRNNIASSAAPVLFNFDGFLRQGVGDPRQAQIAIKFEW